ncbi:hypothetical protein CAP35_00360 [Chitinophagaceae bacterium IBVUCB1]|nr:hypothetical protein CAP35_00360 [Chitinophagaceae bacterium IBVUCB1]
MPTLLLLYGFRFFFYSNENNEPAHVHIKKGSGYGKVWIEPTIDVSYFHGFTNGEVKQIMEIVAEHAEAFKTKWYEYFG